MKKRIYQAAFWLSLCAIVVLAVTPQGARLARGSSDKINHAMAFLLLSYLGNNGFEKPFAAIALYLAVFGAFIEVVQFALPYRSFSLFDMLANISGILAFLVIRSAISSFKNRASRRETENSGQAGNR